MAYVHTEIGQSPRSNYFHRLMRYRHLCWNLVGADLRARFRRSRLGLIWAIIQPLCFSLMIALVWGALFQKSFLEYSIYVFSGMLIWEYFYNSVMVSQDSLFASGGYLKQGNIPLIIFQSRCVLSGTVTFLAGFVGLLGLLAVLQKFPEFGPHLLYTPLILPILIVFLAPVAIIFSFLGTQFRDIHHAVGIAINGLFFMSPIMLDREFMNAPHLEFLHYVNPLMPLLDLMRDPILYSRPWDLQDVAVLGVWTVILWAIAIAVSAKFGRKIIFAL